MIFGTVIVAVAVIPFLLLVLPFIFVAFYMLRGYYLLSSRQLKRMEATTRSPVYSTISSSLEGLSTIRAFGVQDKFEAHFLKLQNENTKHYFMFINLARWLGFRLE